MKANGVSLLSVPLFAFTLLSSAISSEVPAILWNIKGSSVAIQPISAFDNSMKDSMSEMFEPSLKDGTSGLVIFMVDKLSMEDLALQPYYEDSNSTVTVLQTFLDQHPFVMYPNVKDPSKKLRKSKCGVEDIYMTGNMEGRLLKAVASALDQHCIVIVHLPHSSSLSESKMLFDSKIFLPAMKTSKKNVIGMFTAKKSSWEATESGSRKARGLLQVEQSNPYFLNVSGCVCLYVENATIFIGGNNGSYALTVPPEASATCDGNTTDLTLTFTGTERITKVVLKYVFYQASSSWGTSNTSVEITGEDVPEGNIDLQNVIDGPNGFSYSCGELLLRTTDPKIRVALVFDMFQIQAYGIGSMFADSVNCVTWFTLPIWMGSFIVLLFLTILNIGVYFLFQAKTMDRFDDPKGKTITVPQTD